MHSYEIREYNNELLRSYNYVFNEHLPLIEEITNIQSIDALVYRIDILHMLYTISLEGNKAKDYFRDFILTHEHLNYISSEENYLLRKSKLTSQDLINFSWHKESIYTLLWCGSIVKKIDYKLVEIDIADYYCLIPPERNFGLFKEDIKLRTKTDLLIMVDFYYNLHWIVKHTKPIDEMKLSIITARRRAIEWFVYNQDWDNIQLDT